MTVPARPELLRVGFGASPAELRAGVDREANVIRGYVVAEAGEFKDKRGMFDAESLRQIVTLAEQAGERGVRSRLGHPNESDDGLTKHLGRSKNFRLSEDGRQVRADLHLSRAAMEEPVGGGKPIGRYAIDLAEEDPGALGSSLVLKSAKTQRVDSDGKPLPPHWMPEQLIASDLVAEGDAVHGDLLSAGADGLDALLEGSTKRLPTKLASAGAEYLDQLFPDADREVVGARLDGFRDRYLSRRFGPAEPNFKEETVTMDQETKHALESLQASTDTRLSELAETMDEKLQALNKLIAGDIESRREEQTQRDRAAEIAALCKQAGDPNAEQYIADETLSVEDVMRKLIAAKATDNGGLSGSGGDEKPNPVQKLRREYDSQKDLLTAAGYSNREAWVEDQCVDRGMEYTPAV